LQASFPSQEILEVRFRNRRLLSLLLVALASVAALVLSACGGGDDGDSGDAKALLTEAFSNPIKSANVSLDLSAKIDGVPQLSQPITFKMTGPYESRGEKKVPKVDWDINVSAAGQTFSGGLISTGENAFVSFQGQNYEVGSQLVQQYEQQLGQQTQNPTSLKQYGVDPTAWIRDAQEDGEEDVAGAATTKVTGTLDIEKMLNDFNTLVEKAGPAMGQTNTQKLTPEQIAQIKQVVKDPEFEAFVAKDDKTLRRLSATINFTIPESQRQQASGASGGNIKFALQFANVGQPAQVSEPADAKPLSELQQQLGQGGLGGLGGSGGSGSGSGGSGGSGGSSGSGSSPSSEDFQKYADCLEGAKGDSAEIEKCSSLLR
jgi:hypothetical protein